MDRSELTTLILLVIPIFLIQLVVIIYAMRDLRGRELVRGRRSVWTALLVIGLVAVPTGLIIAALYLSWGRNLEAQDDPH